MIYFGTLDVRFSKSKLSRGAFTISMNPPSACFSLLFHMLHFPTTKKQTNLHLVWKHAPLLSSWVNIYHSCLILSIYNSNKYIGSYSMHLYCMWRHFTVSSVHSNANLIPWWITWWKIRYHQHYPFSPLPRIRINQDVTPDLSFILPNHSISWM